MWFETLILTVSVLISSVEVNESVNAKLFEDSKRNCDGDIPWILTEYKRLGIVPLKENNTKCLQATPESCRMSHLIDFSSGAVELNVYVKLFLNESDLTVSVLNENDFPLIDYKLNRLEKDYTEGWNKILLVLEDDIVGFLSIKARINKGELIVIDSYQYIQSVITRRRQDEIKNKLPPVIKNLVSKKRIRKSILGTTQASKNFESNGETNPEQVATTETTQTNSGQVASVETTETTNEEPVHGGVIADTEPHNEELEQGGSTDTLETSDRKAEQIITANTEPSYIKPLQREHGDNTPASELNSVANTTEDLDQVNKDSTSSTEPGQNNFWTPITITLVAVGSFVVLSVIAVSAYYCGKMRARKEDVANFIIEEDIRPEPIIPRVRNVNRF